MAVNKCIKYLLFFFNLLFWLSGCLILAVAIYLKVGKSVPGITNLSIPGVDLMIAIGAIIMVLGFLGCCGAIRENRCLLLLFFIGLLLIFILLLAAGIVGAASQNTAQVKDLVTQNLQKFVPLSNQPADVIAAVNDMQTELKCCGLVNGPSDWTVVPSSCRCNATVSDCSSSAVYTTPCSTQLITLVQKNLTVVLGIAFAIAILMIFGMVFSMILYCQIGRKETVTVAA